MEPLTQFITTGQNLLAALATADPASAQLLEQQQHLGQTFAQLRLSLEPTATDRQRVALTEMYRLLRLSDRESQFWATARPGPSRQLRQQQWQQHLQRLVEWTAALGSPEP